MKSKTICFFITLIVITFFCFYILNNQSKIETTVSATDYENSSLINNILNASGVYNSYYENQDILDLHNLPILVYRYHKYSCDACIYKELALLYDLLKDIGKDKILILPSYDFSRRNMIKLKNELDRFNYINLSYEYLSIPQSPDGNYNRYFFVVNTNRKIEMVFFPSQENSDFTEKYLDNVKNFFFN